MLLLAVMLVALLVRSERLCALLAPPCGDPEHCSGSNTSSSSSESSVSIRRVIAVSDGDWSAGGRAVRLLVS